MDSYDEQLKELQEQIAKKKSEETILESLRKNQKELEDTIYELECKQEKEQADVDTLEQSSLTNLFYKVTGKMEGMLAKERQEVCEALEQYDAVCKELEMVKKDIRHHEMEFGRVRRSEEKYQLLLKEKAEALKMAETPEATQIKHMDERLIQLGSREKELNDAISACNTSKYLVESILSGLSEAEKWGKWDLIDSSWLGEWEKHSNLDKAQEQVERLREELSRLKVELTEVQLQANMQVNFDIFIKSVDYFRDNILIDWTILNVIKQSKSEVQNIGSQIESVLSRLNTLLTRNRQAQKQLKGELDRLVQGMQM